MVDIAKMQKRKAESEKESNFFKPVKGETLLFVHPQVYPDDKVEPTAGLNYVEAVYHYSVGKDIVAALCLNVKKNPILKHPIIQEFLKKAGKVIKLDGECPVCAALPMMDEERANDCRAQTKYVWGVTPLTEKGPKEEKARALEVKPSVFSCGKQVWDGLVELYNGCGDISDLNAAVFVKVTKTGEGKTGTKYTVSADMASARQPKKLPAGVASLIKDAMAPGGDCDVFRVVAGSIRTAADLKAGLGGIAVDDGSAAPAKKGAAPVVEEEDDIPNHASGSVAFDPTADEAPPPKAAAAAPAKKAAAPAPAAADDDDDGVGAMMAELTGMSK